MDLAQTQNLNRVVAELRFSAGLGTHEGWWQTTGIPSGLVNACQNDPRPRTVAKLTRYFAKHLPLPDMGNETLIPAELLELNPKRIARIECIAGAIWHGERLKWVIQGLERARLCKKIGLDVFGIALRHADLCQVKGERIETGILIDSIRLDGARCWQAWLGHLEPCLRSRVVLLSPPQLRSVESWNAKDKKSGTAIVDRIMKLEGMWR